VSLHICRCWLPVWLPRFLAIRQPFDLTIAPIQADHRADAHAANFGRLVSSACHCEDAWSFRRRRSTLRSLRATPRRTGHQRFLCQIADSARLTIAPNEPCTARRTPGSGLRSRWRPHLGTRAESAVSSDLVKLGQAGCPDHAGFSLPSGASSRRWPAPARCPTPGTTGPRPRRASAARPGRRSPPGG
jgi:hypothetical protein